MKMNGVESEKAFQMAERLEKWCSNDQIKLLFDKYRNNKKIKWKESIKKTMGIEMPNEIGLDL
jgi:type IV secretory pathway VirB4 component